MYGGAKPATNYEPLTGEQKMSKTDQLKARLAKAVQVRSQHDDLMATCREIRDLLDAAIAMVEKKAAEKNQGK